MACPAAVFIIMGRMKDRAADISPKRFWAQDYAEDLRRFLAKRRLIEADAKDICQEVFLRLLRFEHSQIVQNPQAYLLRVAANVAHDFRLREARWAPLETAGLDEVEGESNVERQVEDAARTLRVQRALAGLPPLMRAALALQSREDLTYEEIAARLGTTRRSVKRAVARGYAALREQLAAEE